MLDLEVLERNLLKMQTLAAGAGKALRPHVKTHKCSALAKRQLESGAIGLCVAKVSEAEGLVNSGLDNLLVTGPVATPGKVERLLDLLERSPSLMVVVDHPMGVELLEKGLRKRDMSMGVLLDLDVGLHRTGVLPQEALALADGILSSSRLRLQGIQAYAGQVQHIHSYAKRKRSSLLCLQDAVSVFRHLQSKAPSCAIFSASGTGTCDIDLAVPEISELQVGSYVLMDAEYLALESAEDKTRDFFPPALTLLTTVISANQRDVLTVDAGLKAVYQDGGKPEIVRPAGLFLEYDWFGDEYGLLRRTGEGELPQLGTVLELVVSHCDPTVNLFDSYHLTRGNEVLGTWDIDLRGCSQ